MKIWLVLSKMLQIFRFNVFFGVFFGVFQGGLGWWFFFFLVKIEGF